MCSELAARPRRLHYGSCPRERGWNPAGLAPRRCQPRPPLSGRVLAAAAPSLLSSQRRCRRVDPCPTPPLLCPRGFLNSSSSRKRQSAYILKPFTALQCTAGPAHVLSSSYLSLITNSDLTVCRAGSRVTVSYTFPSVGANQSFSRSDLNEWMQQGVAGCVETNPQGVFTSSPALRDLKVHSHCLGIRACQEIRFGEFSLSHI